MVLALSKGMQRASIGGLRLDYTLTVSIKQREVVTLRDATTSLPGV